MGAAQQAGLRCRHGHCNASLVIGLTVSTWQAVQATQAKGDALAARKQAETNEHKAIAAQASEATLRKQAEASEARVRQTSYSTEMLFAADEIKGESESPPLLLDRVLAAFRLHATSKTGRLDRRQFDEQYAVACRHAGPDRLTRWAHRLNVEKIVWAYRVMRVIGV